MSTEKLVHKLNISGGNSELGKGLSILIELPESGKNKPFQQIEGKKIGDVIKGGLIGFTNYEFEITGGSDSSGFAMRKGIHGPVKKKILVSKRGIGFRPTRKGEKRRKAIRGNEVTADMTVVNVKVVKYGESTLFTKSKD